MGTKESGRFLDEAYKYYMMGRELLETADYDSSIQAAQSCIEMSIKSLFDLVDLAYPPLHDPTTKINMVVKRLVLPERFSLVTEGAQRLIFLSKLSKTFHSFSIYGYLDAGTSKIFQKRDAQFLLDYAFEAWNICGQIIAAVRSKQITIL